MSPARRRMRARRALTNLVFGGPEFDVLYATCNEAVYRRKTKVRRVNAWAAPVD